MQNTQNKLSPLLTMFRKMLFAVSLLSLLMPTGCVAIQAKDESLAYKSAPEKNSSELANGKLMAFLPRDKPARSRATQ